MPNRPSTPHRTMRIPNDEWDAIKRQAQVEGITATDLVRKAVRRYIDATVLALSILSFIVGCGLTVQLASPDRDGRPAAPTAPFITHTPAPASTTGPVLAA